MERESVAINVRATKMHNVTIPSSSPTPQTWTKSTEWQNAHPMSSSVEKSTRMFVVTSASSEAVEKSLTRWTIRTATRLFWRNTTLSSASALITTATQGACWVSQFWPSYRLPSWRGWYTSLVGAGQSFLLLHLPQHLIEFISINHHNCHLETSSD